MRHDNPTDPVEAMLRAQQQYIDDAGFTERVMAALPPRRDELSLRSRVLMISGAVAGVVLVAGPLRAFALQLAGGRYDWPLLGAGALALLVGAGTVLWAALREIERA